MKCIGVSGTPGTGKTAVAESLATILQMPFIDLSRYVIENKLYLFYDRKRSSYVIDEERLREDIKQLHHSVGGMVIASHYIEVLPKELFELVFVLRRSPLELINVLRQRGWPDTKIAENVESELLSVCTINAVEELGEELVVEVDVTSRSVAEVVDEILAILYGEKPVYHGVRVDWLSVLSPHELDAILKYIESGRSTDTQFAGRYSD